MKKLACPSLLSRAALGGGVLCLVLRQWLLTNGVEVNGLLDHSHPGNWMSWIVTAVMVAVLILSGLQPQSVRIVPGKGAFFGLVLSALGYLAAGSGLLLAGSHPLRRIAAVLAVAAAVCNFWMAVGMCRRKRVPALTFAPAIVFFLVYMVCRYQPWSSEPEPQYCFFHILALAGLTVTSYLRSAIAQSRKNWKGYAQVSRWAVFASIAAVPGCVDAVPLTLWAAALLLDGCKARKSL